MLFFAKKCLEHFFAGQLEHKKINLILIQSWETEGQRKNVAILLSGMPLSVTKHKILLSKLRIIFVFGKLIEIVFGTKHYMGQGR